jgi:hypothetical protein
VAKEGMINRARDELFSHINRCGVLQAEESDQQHWMEETIDYLAERYPDLTDADLQDLFSVGMRFCSPAIPHGRKRFGFNPEVGAGKVQTSSETADAQEALVPQDAASENTTQES